ncbi:MAG: hypothetical protein SF182_06425 [Deltaproteobacteria bacterium]|nr:hypothetical protein [Deltaproteobacteria bacterium]
MAEQRTDTERLPLVASIVIAVFLLVPTFFCHFILWAGGVPAFDDIQWVPLLTWAAWLGSLGAAALWWERSRVARSAPMLATIALIVFWRRGPIDPAALLGDLAIAVGCGAVAWFSIWIQVRDDDPS